ncbi:hypothetical protein GQ607_009076, partial [Colletotrichum asianum]
ASQPASLFQAQTVIPGLFCPTSVAVPYPPIPSCGTVLHTRITSHRPVLSTPAAIRQPPTAQLGSSGTKHQRHSQIQLLCTPSSRLDLCVQGTRRANRRRRSYRKGRINNLTQATRPYQEETILPR